MPQPCEKGRGATPAPLGHRALAAFWPRSIPGCRRSHHAPTMPAAPALRRRHGRLVDSPLLSDLNLPRASQPEQRVQGLLDPHCFMPQDQALTWTRHHSCQVSGVKCKVNRAHTKVLSNPSCIHAKNQ